jgi:hypothetical protein
MNDSIETEPVFQGIFVIWGSYGRPGPREEANPCPRKGATFGIDSGLEVLPRTERSEINLYR